jgi:hypothetical protein
MRERQEQLKGLATETAIEEAVEQLPQEERDYVSIRQMSQHFGCEDAKATLIPVQTLKVFGHCGPICGYRAINRH